MKDKNIRITRCYLVEYIDKDGKEVESDFCFGTKEDVEKLAMKLKTKHQQRNYPTQERDNVMTNFDFIKNMNIEQMADFIRLISYYEDDTTPMLSFTLDEKYKSLRCQKNEIIKWLNSEKIN